jgi:membrane-associated protein
VLWAGAYVSVGWLAAGSFRQLASQLHYAGYLFAAIIVVFLGMVLLAKKLIVRSEARHMDLATDTAERTEEAPEK